MTEVAAPNGNSGSVPSAVLGAKIDFLIDEFRALRAASVPRGEYEIAQKAIESRITVVESTLKQQGDRRWQVVLAVVAAGLSTLSTIITAVIAATHH